MSIHRDQIISTEIAHRNLVRRLRRFCARVAFYRLFSMPNDLEGATRTGIPSCQFKLLPLSSRVLARTITLLQPKELGECCVQVQKAVIATKLLRSERREGALDLEIHSLSYAVECRLQ